MSANIWKYYLLNFTAVFVIYTPFIIYYFQELGFSLSKIGVLMSAAAITGLILDIPTGYFADRYGRKNSIILAVVVGLISLITLYLAKDFYTVLLVHILFGIATAFISGADVALVYDSLLALKRQDEFKKVRGKGVFFASIAGVLSSLVGAAVVIYGIPYTILSAIFVYVFVLFIALSFVEPKVHKKIKTIKFVKELKNFKRIIIKSIRNEQLLGLFMYAFIILGITDTIFVNYQPYFRETGLSLPTFGIVFAIFSIVHGVTSLKAEYIEKKLGILGSLLIMPILLACALLGASYFFVWFGFLFFLMREAAQGFFLPVIGDYTNKITSSEERATVLSIQSMFSRVGFAIIVISFGFFSDNYGLKPMLQYLGIFVLVITLITFLKTHKRLSKRFITSCF